MKPNSIVRGKVQLAIERLAGKYPLHGGILSRLKLIETCDIETMAVSYAKGHIVLMFSPEFVQSISMSETIGVLHHECNHILFKHIFRTSDEGENQTARTIAEEVTVNEWVGEKLPGSPILLSDYPELPANEDTDTRYERLSKNHPESPDSTKDEIKNAVGDSHSHWKAVISNSSMVEDIADDTIAEAWFDMSSEQQENTPEKLGDIAKNAGTGSNGQVTELGASTGKLPWQVLLRQYTGKAVERTFVFSRPPRRFPHLAGLVPGRGRSVSKPKVMACIDTSGSLDDETLSEISAELTLMAQSFEIIVVECDDEIHSVYPFRPMTDVTGRGGTDLRPPFQPEFLKHHQPDLIIYFTDGYGPAPKKAPAIPVIWVITEDGEVPAKWGREIYMNNDAEKHNFSTS